MNSVDNSGRNGKRRAELVETAAKVIGIRGVEGTRLSDVANEADVSIGLLQHYFGTRDVLIREAFEIAVVGDFEEQLESHRRTDDPWQRIVLVLSEIISPPEPVEEAQNWLSLCAAAARDPELQPTVTEVQKRWVRLLEHAITDGIERGLFDPSLPTTEVAEAINLLGDGMVLNLALGFSTDGLADAESMRTSAERVTSILLGRKMPT